MNRHGVLLVGVLAAACSGCSPGPRLDLGDDGARAQADAGGSPGTRAGTSARDAGRSGELDERSDASLADASEQEPGEDCLSDADCAGTDAPFCAPDDGCVECLADEHCTDPGAAFCSEEGSCAECTEDAHCPAGSSCDSDRCQ